ncbi:S-layer homology domain-containing protein [Terrihalobacillus insolitus]|uniref:S-layer homology domain-containing protein n=1 Tax=Terrihalobacillus insolitus TaxID=2950438 RepID=UPI0023411077|nr:S-layer homology domain-containing protein [Terrihalobacillus insolitus]
MAAPHVAGIIALMLDADPTLSPLEVKKLLQQTATNIPGREAWEVGAGYVNAYAAVDAAFTSRDYGSTVNKNTTFQANVDMEVNRENFSMDYDPINTSDNTYSVQIEEGLTEFAARIYARGLLEETGNTINLVLTSPDGTTYSSGIYVAFPLYQDRTVQVVNPIPGTWTITLEGLEGLALPETVNGELTFKQAKGFTGLSDISGHSAEAAIKLGVSERLLDSNKDNMYEPDKALLRKDLAKYLVMGAGVRQFLPLNREPSFKDVKQAYLPFVEAVFAKGAALKDISQVNQGIMDRTGTDKFSPNKDVTRADLAFSLVQSLGLEEQAMELNGDSLTVQYKGERIPIKDAADVPNELRGYVQLALDMNIMNAYFSSTQNPYDLEPTMEASFAPSETVTRGDFAVMISRYFSAYQQ